MFINYKDSNVLSLGYANDAAMLGKTTPQDVHWLRPGWNEFSRAVWDQNKTAPTILKLLKKGKIELMEEKVTVTVTDKKTGRKKKVVRVIGQDDKPVRLKYFDEPKAVKIVKETLNRDLLQRWMDEENRHKVKRALAKQIEPLLSENQADDEDKEDDEDETSED